MCDGDGEVPRTDLGCGCVDRLGEDVCVGVLLLKVDARTDRRCVCIDRLGCSGCVVVLGGCVGACVCVPVGR